MRTALAFIILVLSAASVSGVLLALVAIEFVHAVWVTMALLVVQMFGG